MSGICSSCDQLCTFKDPPKNPGDIFGFPCDWCKSIKCKNCAKFGASEVRAIATVSRSIPYICKDCSPKLKNLFDVEARMTALEQQIEVIKLETKNVSGFFQNMEILGEDIKAIRSSFTSSFEELKTEISSLKSSVTHQHRPSPSHSTSPSVPNNMDALLSEVNDRALRANNVIVYNVPEPNSQMIRDRIQEDHQKITDLLLAINTDSASGKLSKVIRLGKPRENFLRPLKVVFTDSGTAKEVLISASKASTRHTYKVKNDLTVMQRECIRKLVVELSRRRNAGEKNLTLRFKNDMPYIAATADTTKAGLRRKNAN